MRLPLLAALALIPAATLADVPQVVTDTAPVQSLVARVMGDLGEPSVLIPPGTSPHDAALRPSDAASLEGADVVIWTGPDLLPMLQDPIDTLAWRAVRVGLLRTGGWGALPLREDADFAAGHDHDHGDDSAEWQVDPHGWLDPAVAAIWVGTIAQTLSAVDPDNAAVYQANAEAAAAEYLALRDRLAAELAPLAGRGWLAPHDGYQYFENAFGLPAAGAVTLADAAAPGPAHIADLRARIAAEGVVCLLTDPQTPADLVALVTEGTTAPHCRRRPRRPDPAAGPGPLPRDHRGDCRGAEGLSGGGVRGWMSRRGLRA